MASIEDLSPGAADAIRGGINAVEKTVDSDLDGDGDTGEEGSKKEKSGKKITSRDETKYIQRVIDPEEKHTKADGQWGGGTNTAWKEWVTSDKTIDKIRALQAKADRAPAGDADVTTGSVQESIINRNISSLLDLLINEQAAGDDISVFVNANAGSAARIATKLGYDGNLAGVHQMVQDLEAVETDVEEKDQEPAEEQAEKEVSEEEDTAVADGASYALASLRIPKEKFKTRKDEYIEPAREGRTTKTDVRTAEELPEAIRDDDAATLRTFRRMFYVKKYDGGPGAIIIKKPGINHVLIGFKEDGDFIVGLPRTAQESLSRGSLIRKRYYGRY
jgi:hypothetical protein